MSIYAPTRSIYDYEADRGLDYSEEEQDLRESRIEQDIDLMMERSNGGSMSEEQGLVTASGHSLTVSDDEEMGFNVQSLIAQAISENQMDTVERLVAVRRELKAEAARESYFRALSEFQSRCPEIKKSKHVYDKHNNYRYSFAPLESIVSQVKDLLLQFGFSYMIFTEQAEDRVTATCRVNHLSGHTEETHFSVPIDPDAYMNDQQKPASANTYAKRYAFCNAFGIMTADQDDDADTFNFDTGVKYSDYIKALEQETDPEALRKMGKEFHSDLKAQGDDVGAKVVLSIYNRCKAELKGHSNEAGN